MTVEMDMEPSRKRNSSHQDDLRIDLLLAAEEPSENNAYNNMSGDGYSELPSPSSRRSTLNYSWKKFAMLLILYICQGIPMGLIFGTLPFLLISSPDGNGGSEGGKTGHSYASVGLFTLASQPYNLKLLWSPLVDSLYGRRVGRRKSWIIPMQLLLGTGLVLVGYMANDLFPTDGREQPITKATLIFGCLVAIAATQDIAIDGWALTLLSREHASSSSTLQTIGLNAGYFFSFTIYLILASPYFCDKFLRGEPKNAGIVDLASFLKICGLFYYFTAYLVTRMQPEDREVAPKAGSISLAYRQITHILSLPTVHSLAAALLLGKLAFMPGETLIPLKLLDLGFPKESLAVIALADFSCQLLLSWLIVRGMMMGRERPLLPWQIGAVIKTVMAMVGMWMIAAFPVDGKISPSYFTLVLAHTMLTSFATTVMHVTLSVFFSAISDPTVGGTYMTLLNSLSNLGSTWPKLLALGLVDRLTHRTCMMDPLRASSMTGPFDGSCSTDEAMATCQRLGGRCAIISDGYYVVSWLSILVGLLIMHSVVRPLIWKVEAAPISTWRIANIF